MVRFFIISLCLSLVARADNLAELKRTLEDSGWSHVEIVREFPEKIRGPIDAIATYNFEARGYQFHDKSEHYGEVQTSKVVLLDEVYGAEGVVAARLAPSDPSQIAYHFPPAPDGTKLIIQVNAKEKKGYVLRMLMGGKTEIRFVIRYPEKKRPNQSAQTTPGSSAPLRV